MKSKSDKRTLKFILPLILPLLLLNGCAKELYKPTGKPELLLPDLKEYSPEEQALALKEWQALGFDKTNTGKPSMLQMFIIDYLKMRDQVRNTLKELASGT